MVRLSTDEYMKRNVSVMSFYLEYPVRGMTVLCISFDGTFLSLSLPWPRRTTMDPGIKALQEKNRF